FLTTIIEAMRDGLTVMLTYQSFNRNEPATFEVHPYCVKVFKQRWYLVAYSPWYDAMRIYALDRVFEVETTENRFKLPKNFDAKEYFADAFGIIIDEENFKVERVEVKVMGNQREYIRTLPLHSSQQEVETADDYSVFMFRLRPTFDFQQELRRYGSAVEVLSPAWLCEEFAAETARIAEIYKR
ncbi:MAG: WYL domain-containing protein, partial [Alistipes sp.]|nr:WYL domain-containing protein [Alistipes sp.]